jgi:hypothetical protein
MVRPAAVQLILAWLLAACSAPPTPAAPPRSTFDVRRAAARLALPPDDATREALDDLRAEARQGHEGAGLTRALYLLDLFDHARFAAAPASRKLLFDELGGSAAAPGGELATEWIAHRLDDELAHQGAAPEAAAARELLAIDLGGADAEPLRLLAAARRLARDGQLELRANAILRLYGYCARALRDATLQPYPERAGVANHCLYALFESDPAAYFAEDPRQRPPDPPWTAYRDGLSRLLEALARTSRTAHGAARGRGSALLH